MCSEGVRSYLGRSRLAAERPTEFVRSEKSAEVIVAARMGRRAEGTGEEVSRSSGLKGLRCSFRRSSPRAGEGEARAGAGSEKSIWADREQTTSGGASGNSKRTDLNGSNRPVRTRMPGGVGGERSGQLTAPYPDARNNWNGATRGSRLPLLLRALTLRFKRPERDLLCDFRDG